MILCISANPAIDRRVYLDQLVTGCVNRVHSVTDAPGGKAAHVAMAARALGEEVHWIGFSGSTTGATCERGLTELDIPVTVIRTRSATRTNLEIIDNQQVITEILEPGGLINTDEVDELLCACYTLFAQYRQNAVVVLTGSLSPGVPHDFYAQLIQRARQFHCRTLLDTSGTPLLNALVAKPDFVKLNREESPLVLGHPVTDVAAALGAARVLLAYGAQSAAVTLGKDGLVWLPMGDAVPRFASAVRVAVRSTVGCGDATLAAFAVAAVRRLSTIETLRLAVASAAANCLAEMPGRIQRMAVAQLLSLVNCDELAYD